ncbi:MAG: DcrB-related protein [Phycisphaeraceae bacterium]|nr:DcrB-related protein [Phycisphaeraceae bacterium]
MDNSIFRLAVILVLLLGLSPYGCGDWGSRDPDRFYSREHGFSIKGPEGWERLPGEMGTEIMFLSPMEDEDTEFRANLNVVVENLPKEMDLSAYLQVALDQLSKVMTDFQKLDQGEVTIADKPGKRLEYTHRMGVFRFHVDQYFVVHSNRAYVITCTAVEGTLDDYRDEFKAMLDSMQFK